MIEPDEESRLKVAHKCTHAHVTVAGVYCPKFNRKNPNCTIYCPLFEED